METTIAKFAIIGLAGIGSQWLAWRFRVPAIVLLAAAGLLLGPATGLIVPERDFGRLLQPMVAIAVAIILFEGGFTLNFQEIRQTSAAVRRLVIIGAPLAWVLNTAAGYFVAGLPLAAAIILGGVLVVTGPTVIMPLLRQSNLTQRPASLLRWEAIVNDPVGALFAVLAFEAMIVAKSGGPIHELVFQAVLGFAVAFGGGLGVGRGIAAAFNRGYVPEFLKAPVLLVVVLGAYVVSNAVLEESGLLTVTILGITLANCHFADAAEIRRFKETVTVLLVSGVFVMLSASIDAAILSELNLRTLAFVAVMLLVVRPLTTWIATIGAGLTLHERALIGWIAPRGVVAIAVSSFFAGKLAENYVDGGRQMIALAFAMVISTVILHGFSLGPLSRRLGLAAQQRNGVLIVGGQPWSTGLARKLLEHGLPVLIVDSNWNDLREARADGLNTAHLDILSETAEFTLDLGGYGTLIAATDNDAYNTLVCSDYVYDFERAHVLQLMPADRRPGTAADTSLGRGGEILQASQSAAMKVALEPGGPQFTATRITAKFGLADLLASKGADWVPVAAIKPNKQTEFATTGRPFKPVPDDIVIGFDARAMPPGPAAYPLGAPFEPA